MRRVWQVRPMRQIQQRRRQKQMQQQMQQQQPKDKNNWGAAQGQGKLWGGAEVRRARGPEKNHAVGRVRGYRPRTWSSVDPIAQLCDEVTNLA